MNIFLMTNKRGGKLWVNFNQVFYSRINLWERERNEGKLEMKQNEEEKWKRSRVRRWKRGTYNNLIFANIVVRKNNSVDSGVYHVTFFLHSFPLPSLSSFPYSLWFVHHTHTHTHTYFNMHIWVSEMQYNSRVRKKRKFSFSLPSSMYFHPQKERNSFRFYFASLTIVPHLRHSLFLHFFQLSPNLLSFSYFCLIVSINND